MTVIAWDGKFLAVDKQINNGESKFSGTKIKRLEDGTLLAWNGIIDAGNILVDWYENGADKEKFPFKVEDKALADLVVVSPEGKVFCYCQSAFPHTFDSPFMAWGIGRDAAMGAMEMGSGAILAVKIASKYVDGCGFGVDYFDVQRIDTVKINRVPSPDKRGSTLTTLRKVYSALIHQVADHRECPSCRETIFLEDQTQREALEASKKIKSLAEEYASGKR